MSRSGYSAYLDEQALNLWRGTLHRAIHGKRGQALLRDLLAALDAMPDKRLAAESLVTADGEYCALGALGARRGMDLAGIDPDDIYTVAEQFNIARALAAEIVFMNDEYETKHRWAGNKWIYAPETGEERWLRMRKWVAEQINNKESQ